MGVALGNKVIQVSGGRVYQPSSVYRMVSSAAPVKSPSLTIYSFPLFYLLPPTFLLVKKNKQTNKQTSNKNQKTLETQTKFLLVNPFTVSMHSPTPVSSDKPPVVLCTWDSIVFVSLFYSLDPPYKGDHKVFVFL